MVMKRRRRNNKQKPEYGFLKTDTAMLNPIPMNRKAKLATKRQKRVTPTVRNSDKETK